MLKTKTVFILGAGASISFGFPSGYALMALISNACQEIAKGTYTRLDGINLNVSKVKQLLRAINEDGFFSIDALLGVRTELNDIGKLLIASCLLPYEDEGRLFGYSFRQQNWMLYLFELLKGQTLAEFGDNEVTFVTFIYDRSLDFCFRKQLKDRYPKEATPEAIEQIMQKIPIIHIHGQLGSLQHIPFNHNNRQGSIALQAANGIRIIHEADDKSPEFEAAWRALDAAKRIGVLGFGYDTTNMARLHFTGYWLRSKTIIGTCKGMSAMETHKVLLSLKNGDENKENVISFYRGDNHDCLWLLKNPKLGYDSNIDVGSDSVMIHS